MKQERGRQLYDQPKRPTLRASAQVSSRKALGVATSPLLALAIALCAWIIPNIRFQNLLRIALAVMGFYALWNIVEYLLRWRRYVLNLEDRLRGFRGRILANAKIDDVPGAEF